MIPRVRFDVIAGLYNDFLNYLIENDFYITGIKSNNLGFSAVCLAKDYIKMARMAKKFQCRTKVIKKKGLYFKVKFILARKGILLGTVLLLLCLVLYSGIIWRIDIKTEDPKIKEDIYRLLYANEIYVGSVFSEEKNKSAIQEIFMKIDNIGYVTLNFSKGIISGEVEKEIKKLPYLEERHTGNILSSADGTITDLRVYNGFSQVVTGQTVQKGTVLVSATMLNKNGELMQVQPHAYVKAYCNKQYSSEVDFEKEAEVTTGEIQKQVILKTLGQNLQVKKAKIDNWDIFDSRVEFEYFKMLGFRLPLTVERTNYYQKEKINIKRDEKLAQDVAKNIIKTLIENDKSVIEIEKKDYYVEKKDNSIKVTCTVFGYYDITK